MITLDEFKKNNPKKCRLIGLDLGSKRIGVAICDENWSIATPFKTIQKTTNENLIKELKNIVLETDSPYLAPTPHRGKRNDSSYLIHIVDKLSEIYGVENHEIASITTNNAVELFNLDN